jgi:hypothetical protein
MEQSKIPSELYNTFYRGWYYHRDTDGAYYEEHNFQHSSEVILMSNEIELLCEDFYNTFLDQTEFPPCYLVLSFINNKWVCFIDFFSGSTTHVYITFMNKTISEIFSELFSSRIFHVEIGDYKLDEWESAQQKALEALTEFITNR